MQIKAIIMSIALAVISCYSWGQDLKSKQIRLDTAAGHGFEVMYIADPVQKQLYDHYKPVKVNFFREQEVTWQQATLIADTLNKQGWYIPSMSQLKMIFNITQSAMNQKRIGPGATDWQGIYGLFWTLNNTEHNINDEQTVALAGTINNRDFVTSDVRGKGLIETDDIQRGGRKRLKLLLIRTY